MFIQSSFRRVDSRWVRSLLLPVYHFDDSDNSWSRRTPKVADKSVIGFQSANQKLSTYHHFKLQGINLNADFCIVLSDLMTTKVE